MTSQTPKGAWRFAPTGGGVVHGFNHAGTEHFKHDPIVTLIRETIQNSLDAHQPDAPPVEVDFRECSVAPEHIGADSLRRHLEQALVETRCKGQTEGQKSYQEALTLLNQPTIPCLAILDRNTTGLQGNKWDSLIREEGIPAKDGDIAHGGSFGIGKNASYNVAGLHTVIYSTRYLTATEQVMKMTGRAQLVSHRAPETGEMLQHIGFYTDSTDQPLIGTDIPPAFRLETSGTGIWIVGFMPKQRQWFRKAERATIDNFFHALHTRQLIVNLHPPKGAEVIRLDHVTTPDSRLRGNAASKTCHYHKAVIREPIGQTTPVGCFGAMNVYLNQEPNAPKRVAYVNRRGMLITDSKDRRISNPFHPGPGHSSWPDYAAVVIAMDDETDRQVRRMENPAHDKISLNRLPEEEKEQIASSLDKVNGQIRSIIEDAIRELDEADISNLTELAAMFPDMDLTQQGNRDLDTRVVPHYPRHRVTSVDDNRDQLEESDDLSETEPGLSTPGGSGNTGSHSKDPARVINERAQTKPQRRAVRKTCLMRKQQGQLVVALIPDPKAEGPVLFSLHPQGEETLPERRISITDISAITPLGVEVTHENDIITVVDAVGNTTPVMFTVHVHADVPAMGYHIMERQRT